nr:lysoplasmalogenase [uncultured Allomuricauda sp.]
MVMEISNLRKTINVLSMISALAAIIFDYLGQTFLYSICKPLTTVLILSLLFFVTNNRMWQFKNIIIAALIFCLIGDVLLLKEEYFVFGLGSFLIGHLLFATGFIKLEGFQYRWTLLFILMAIGGGLFIWLQPDLGSMEIPVGVYVIVIVFMAWQGTGLFLKQQQKVYSLIGIAVLLFMFSDTIIAINKFKTTFKLSGLVILSTYWLSISLIANASFLILRKKS